MVLDVVQVQLHQLGLLWCVTLNWLSVLALEYVESARKVSLVVALLANEYLLAHLELNLLDRNAALAVVDRDHGLGDFICIKDVLLEANIETC